MKWGILLTFVGVVAVTLAKPKDPSTDSTQPPTRCLKNEHHTNKSLIAGSAARRLIPESNLSTWPVRVQSPRIGGAICGAYRTSYNGASYATFRGVPYAKAPVGELRFLAPQPVDPWDGCFDATYEGPICPQRDIIYGSMMQPRSMGEDCLRVNVHVPATSLPRPGSKCIGAACLPVLVYVPGGGFQSGSGDSDVNGPEYMVDKNVVVVTFNYRLGPFGFLSLNTSSVPGNTGLRDMVAALEWVQNNIRAFGGDPDKVTLMGQSAGSSAAHILSLSKATTGLFSKLILMSGTANVGYFSTTSSYSQFVLTSFLGALNITSNNTEEIFNQLIELPYETLVEANSEVVDALGFISFCPVVESEFDGVTRILDDDPDLLMAQGRGITYPLLVGYTNVECETFRHRIEDIDVLAKIEADPTAILPPKLVFSATDDVKAMAAERMLETYFNETMTIDNYIPVCSESFIIYPALKLAESRVTTGGASVFLYEFSYNSDYAPSKQALGLNYTGAGHLEDLSYVLRVNSILNGTKYDSSDESVKDWMTNIVNNFVRHSNPTGAKSNNEAWPAVACPLQYQVIFDAAYAVSNITADQQAMIELYDSFYSV